MTIASEIQRINTNIANAYTSASQKGATLPEDQNSANLAQTISTIQGGSGPNIYPYTLSDGTLTRNSGNITFTGVESVGTYGMYYSFYTNQDITSVSFPDLTSIGAYGLSNTFERCTYLNNISFSNLESISNYGMGSAFSNCNNLTTFTLSPFSKLTNIGDHGLEYVFYFCKNLVGEAYFPELVSINGQYAMTYAFSSSPKITKALFPKLKTMSSYSLQSAFRSCTGLTEISFPELLSVAISGMTNAFNGCVNLTSISFPKLSSINNYGMQSAFQGCANLTSISFPTLSYIGNYGMNTTFTSVPLSGSISFPSLETIGTNGLTKIFGSGNTGITEVHFKQSLSGHAQCTAANMGCTNASIYFDLP